MFSSSPPAHARRESKNSSMMKQQIRQLTDSVSRRRPERRGSIDVSDSRLGQIVVDKPGHRRSISNSRGNRRGDHRLARGHSLSSNNKLEGSPNLQLGFLDRVAARNENTREHGSPKNNITFHPDTDKSPHHDKRDSAMLSEVAEIENAFSAPMRDTGPSHRTDEPSSYFWTRLLYAGVGLVVILGVFLSFYVGNQLSSIHKTRLATEYKAHALLRIASLQEHLDSYLSGLQNIAAALEGSDNNITAEQFSLVSRASIKARETYMGISWNRWLVHEDVGVFETYVRLQGRDENFTVYENNGTYGKIPAQERQHMVVTYMDPYEPNKAAIGFDLMSVEGRANSLEKVQMTGQPRATELLTLVQDEAAAPAIIVFSPIYANIIARTEELGISLIDWAPEDEEETWLLENFVGTISGVFPVQAVFEASLGDNEEYTYMKVGVWETDDNDTSVPSFYFQANRDNNQTVWYFSEDVSAHDQFKLEHIYRHEASITLGTRVWHIVLWTNESDFSSDRQSFYQLLTASMILATLLVACIALGLNYYVSIRRSLNRTIVDYSSLSLLLSSITDMIIVCDNFANIMLVNPTVMQRTGFDVQELYTMRLDDIVSIKATKNRHERSLMKALQMMVRGRHQPRPSVDPPTPMAVPDLSPAEAVPAYARPMSVQGMRDMQIKSTLEMIIDDGKDSPDRHHHHDKDIHQQDSFSPDSHDREFFQVHVRCKSDLSFRAEANVNEFNLTGLSTLFEKKEMMVIVMRDISARLHAQLELKRAKDTADLANRQKSLFLAFICHELRNPLHGIVGMIDILKETELESTQDECATSIMESAQLMRVIVDDVLDLSKIEAGKQALETIVFSATHLINDLSKWVKPLVPAAVDIKKSLPDNLPNLYGDPTRLRQIFLNLLSNAAKFTHKGHVELKCEVLIDYGDSMRLRFSISDTGEGIPEKSIPHLFQSYSQAKTSTTREHGGTGLGLCIVAGLVKQMGGAVVVESAVNVGTTFSFAIDMKKDVEGVTVDSPDAGMGNDQRANDLIQGVLMSTATQRVEHRGINNLSTAGVNSSGTLSHNSLPPIDAFSSDRQMPASRAPTPQFHSSRYISDDELLSAQPTPQLDLTSLNDSKRAPLSPAPTKKKKKKKNKLVLPLHLQEFAANYTVLVVEDIPVNQKIVVTMLKKKFNMQTLIAANGMLALDVLANNLNSGQQQIGLVLTDINMPVMNGKQMMAEIRKNPEYKHIKLVALTGNAMYDDVNEIKAAGADSVIIKPFKSKDLLKTFAEVCSVEELE